VIWGIVLYGAWHLRTPFKIALGKGSRPFRRWYRSFNMGRGGSAGFASIMEEWANRWRPGMIFFGHSLHDREWPIGIRDDRMVTTLAGTGGGKNVAAIIPVLLSYEKGSVFVMDVKGQNAAVTAQARKDMGQDVYTFDPFGAETARLNPLDFLDPDAVDYVEKIKGIVEAMVIATDERNRVWTEWSKIVIEGLIDFEKRRPPYLYELEEAQAQESGNAE
jgi:type IV secretory pathway TraG/TraD family ATPase VirD4